MLAFLDFLSSELGLIIGLIAGIVIGRVTTIPMWEADLSTIAGTVIAYIGNRFLKRGGKR